jgi:hypothetical protein
MRVRGHDGGTEGHEPLPRAVTMLTVSLETSRLALALAAVSMTVNAPGYS